EHCLADPIVVSIPERITGLKLSPGCFIDIIDNLEFESLERTRMPERAHGEPPLAQRRSRGREKPRPDVRRVTGASAARRLARRGEGVAPDLTRGPTLAARQTHSWLECSENETPGECSNTWLQEA